MCVSAFTFIGEKRRTMINTIYIYRQREREKKKILIHKNVCKGNTELHIIADKKNLLLKILWTKKTYRVYC